MDRQKIERSIKGLSEWQRHVQADSDIDANISTAIEALKAQLSQEGTTSDTISKTETVEHLRKAVETTVPITDYDGGFIDGIEFSISTVSTMPTTQTVATDMNVGDKISRQALCEYALNQKDKSVTPNDIMRFPSAQPETAKRIVGKSRDGMTLWYQCDMCNEPVDELDDYCRGCGRRLIDG